MLRKSRAVGGYMLHADSFLVLAILAILLCTLEWAATLPGEISPLAFPAARLTYAFYFYLVARKAAAGSRRLPTLRDYRDSWDALILPLLKALVATLPLWAALLIFARFSTGLVGFIERYEAQPLALLRTKGLLGYAVLAGFAIHLPVALCATMLDRSLLACLDPTVGYRLLLPAASRYVEVFGLLCLAGIAGLLLDGLGDLLASALPIPLATPVLCSLLRLLVPLGQARLLGDFVHENRGVLV
jgi:hypothetical protein